MTEESVTISENNGVKVNINFKEIIQNLTDEELKELFIFIDEEISYRGLYQANNSPETDGAQQDAGGEENVQEETLTENPASPAKLEEQSEEPEQEEADAENPGPEQEQTETSEPEEEMEPEEASEQEQEEEPEETSELKEEDEPEEASEQEEKEEEQEQEQEQEEVNTEIPGSEQEETQTNATSALQEQPGEEGKSKSRNL
jgi:hypothetical protein